MVFKNKNIKKIYLKLISFVLSLFLWIYVVSSEHVVLEKNFNIRYISPVNYTVSSLAPTEIAYTFKGPRAFLRDFIEKENEITINLSNLKTSKKNQYLVNFKNININMPFGISLISSNPDRKLIDVEPELTKLLALEPIFIGKLDKELKLTSSSLNRKKVLVSGPTTLLNTIKQIESSPIDLGSLKADGKIKLELVLSDNRLKILENEAVYWEYSLRANKANKKISNIPINFLSTKFLKRSSHSKADITILTSNDVEDTSLNKEISIIAEIPPNAQGKTKIKLKAKLPEKAVLLEIFPDTIDVYVK